MECANWRAYVDGVTYGRELRYAVKCWFRGLDSNQDFRLQRPTCYQLHHPGVGELDAAYGFCESPSEIPNRKTACVSLVLRLEQPDEYIRARAKFGRRPPRIREAKTALTLDWLAGEREHDSRHRRRENPRKDSLAFDKLAVCWPGLNLLRC